MPKVRREAGKCKRMIILERDGICEYKSIRSLDGMVLRGERLVFGESHASSSDNS